MVAEDATDKTADPQLTLPDPSVFKTPQFVDEARVVVPFTSIPFRNVSKAVQEAAKVVSREAVALKPTCVTVTPFTPKTSVELPPPPPDPQSNETTPRVPEEFACTQRKPLPEREGMFTSVELVRVVMVEV
jgi:hypothetical protein